MIILKAITREPAGGEARFERVRLPLTLARPSDTYSTLPERGRAVRIVGGTLRGRKLLGPTSGPGIRPTSDKVREAIFDVLAAAMSEGIRGRVIDVFAGTGALGIEALSRGVDHAVFIEQNGDVVGVIKKNLMQAGCADRATVLADSAESALAALEAQHALPFDLAFFDPPYGSDSGARAASLLLAHGLLANHGIIVVESGPGDVVEELQGLVAFRRKRYGDTRVSFFRAREVVPGASSKSATDNTSGGTDGG
jgi:16S rRNA (guanine(966)-N(2))-methyltransferase RsmD